MNITRLLFKIFIDNKYKKQKPGFWISFWKEKVREILVPIKWTLIFVAMYLVLLWFPCSLFNGYIKLCHVKKIGSISISTNKYPAKTLSTIAKLPEDRANRIEMLQIIKRRCNLNLIKNNEELKEDIREEFQEYRVYDHQSACIKDPKTIIQRVSFTIPAYETINTKPIMKRLLVSVGQGGPCNWVINHLYVLFGYLILTLIWVGIRAWATKNYKKLVRGK